MKNIILILLLFISSISYTLANGECSVANVTISTGYDAPIGIGQSTSIEVCLDCSFYNELELGASILVDLKEPTGELSTLEYNVEDYVPETSTCVFMKFSLNNCGTYKVAKVYTANSFGEATVVTSVEYTNGYTIHVDGPTMDNNFDATQYESGFYANAEDSGFKHEWSINGVVSDCMSANCFLYGLPGNTYEVCHKSKINNSCSNVEVCKTFETLCHFEVNCYDIEATSDSCDGDIEVQSDDFEGYEHRIRYRELGENNWDEDDFSFALNRIIESNQEWNGCTTLEIQVQLKCNNQYSPWYESIEITTRPLKPYDNAIAHWVTGNSLSFAINNYPGDAVGIRIWAVGTDWTDLYQVASNNNGSSNIAQSGAVLLPNTTYNYMGQRKCGSNGDYSCFGIIKQFTTPASFNGGGTMNFQGIEEELIIENNLPKILSSPNPSNGRFTLSGDLVKVGNQLTIHNLIGTTVAERTIDDDINMEFNLDLQAGTYFLTIIDRNTGKLTSERIVIQNL